MNSEIDDVCRRVIGALFDGGSRGLLIVAVVWVTLKIFRGANAATRHGAWFATLLILAALPVVEFLNLRSDPATMESLEPIEPTSSPVETFLPISDFDIQRPLDDLPSVQLQPTETAAETIAEPIATPWKISIPQYVGMILVGGWLALAMVRIVGLLWQLGLLHGITQRSLPAPADLKAICGSICREMGLRRKVRLLFSSEISAPMVVGFLNPSVLIPKSIAAETQIEPVMRHELAHVARWDDWANLIQQFIKAIFFFHPGVLLASSRLTAEREIACDDHALAALAAPQDYALFLTEFAGRMRGRDYAAAPAAWSRKSQLKERIVMILDGKRNASPQLDRTRFGAMTAGALALALITLAAGPRLALAETEKAVEKNVAIEAAVAATVETAIEAPVDVAPVVAVVAPAPVVAPKVSVTVPAVAITPVAAAPADVLELVADAPRPPRPSRISGGGDDIERRLERLERMMELLLGNEKFKDKPDWKGPMAMPMPKMPKMAPTPMPPDHLKKDFHGDFNWNFDHEKISKKAGEDAKREIDRARLDVERGKRDMERERAELERERADKQRGQADRQREQAEKQVSQDRRSLEHERQALEEQRRSIEKRIESLEKQIQKRNQENQNSDSNKKSDSNRDSGPKEKP